VHPASDSDMTGRGGEDITNLTALMDYLTVGTCGEDDSCFVADCEYKKSLLDHNRPPDIMTALPGDIIVVVMRHLDVHDLLALSLTSRFFYALVSPPPRLVFPSLTAPSAGHVHRLGPARSNQPSLCPEPISGLRPLGHRSPRPS
jgi:hypothetical protein